MATHLLHMSEKNCPKFPPKHSNKTENSPTQVCNKLMCDPTACVWIVVWRTCEGEETMGAKYSIKGTMIQVLQLWVMTRFRSVFFFFFLNKQHCMYLRSKDVNESWVWGQSEKGLRWQTSVWCSQMLPMKLTERVGGDLSRGFRRTPQQSYFAFW